MLCGGGSIVKTIFDVNRNMPAQHSLLQAVETATDRHGLFVGVFYPAVEQCRQGLRNSRSAVGSRAFAKCCIEKLGVH